MTDLPPEPSRPFRAALVPVLGLACLGAAAAAWYWSARPAPQTVTDAYAPHPDPTPPDPRLTFPTQFRNVRPEVAYVGDDACAGCHARIVRTYRQHPMGRSAEWVTRGTAGAHLAGANNPFTAAAFTLTVEKIDDRVWHRMTATGPDGKPLPPYAVPADLAIGSGRHGRSYLTVDRGAVWQTPISWFHRGERWDVSPGVDFTSAPRRPVVPQCLQCHTDRPEPVPRAQNLYREPLLRARASIGCERCHGPGELHVAEQSAAGLVPAVPDYTIVNPRHLPADLKADVCRQCHLQGASQLARRGRDPAEFRPGLPWEQFMSTFVRHPDLTDYRTAVGQFEQMETSRCFAGSSGKLGCVSCHDPHAAPPAAEAAAYFRGKCLTCHDTRGCSLPAPERRAKDDSCVACHMPERDSSNVSHAAVTDHRIMRRPDAGGPRARRLRPGQFPLVAYPPGPHAPPAEERDRDWAVALGNELARTGAAAPPELWLTIDAKLDAALRQWPGDGPAWLARSRAAAGREDGARAVHAARVAVALHPDSEVALVQLAGSAVAAGDFELAARTADRLVPLNPSSSDHLLTRASAHFSLGDWEKAEADCRAALAIQPLQGNGHFMLAVCRHKRGDPAAARRELDTALGLAPTPRARSALSDWYHQLTR
jgi:Tetratricopeptide repeat/Cytochrome c554 and c-prime